MKPREYKSDDFQKLVNKQILIEVGPTSDDFTITDKFEGTLIQYGLAANAPHLPVDIKLRLLSGEVKYFGIFELKSIKLI
jgi:hypothetical protein